MPIPGTAFFRVEFTHGLSVVAGFAVQQPQLRMQPRRYGFILGAGFLDDLFQRSDLLLRALPILLVVLIKRSLVAIPIVKRFRRGAATNRVAANSAPPIFLVIIFLLLVR